MVSYKLRTTTQDGLFCNNLLTKIISGAERYCKYEGYGSDFKFAGHHEERTPRDASGRRCTSLVAIDAVPLYSGRYKQYQSKLMERELHKAYAGFFVDENCKPIPVASGNWGCGVFGVKQLP